MDAHSHSIQEAVTSLRQGGLVAYPTEFVYGLGCDPFNHNAVTDLLTLKKRSIEKGFILIASSWEQVASLTQPIDPKMLARVFNSWPGPSTWVFPASSEVPDWVRGKHTSVALRVTAHPIAKCLCHQFGGPIVSTSANYEGEPPIRDIRMLDLFFGHKVDSIIEGAMGPSHRPTEIRDAVTGEVLRKA